MATKEEIKNNHKIAKAIYYTIGMLLIIPYPLLFFSGFMYMLLFGSLPNFLQYINLTIVVEFIGAMWLAPWFFKNF